MDGDDADQVRTMEKTEKMETMEMMASNEISKDQGREENGATIVSAAFKPA